MWSQRPVHLMADEEQWKENLPLTRPQLSEVLPLPIVPHSRFRSSQMNRVTAVLMTARTQTF